MTTVISNNLVLSSEVQAQGNAGVIGYQNVLNVSNVTATSALATNPITSVANPATAYTWESAVVDASDVVSYPNVTNLMPSPFDPSGWSSDTDGTITNVTLPNPSGESFVGLAEQGTLNQFNIASTSGQGMVVGEKVYIAVICKPVGGYDTALRFRFADSQGFLGDTILSGSTGARLGGGTRNTKTTSLSDGFLLIEVEFDITRVDANGVGQIIFFSNDNTGEPPIGSQLYVQAAFFGQSASFPAVVQEGGVIITAQTAGQQIDYIGIARHNLDQIGLTVTVKYNGITVIPATPVSSIQAILFLLNEATPVTVEIIIKGATVAPQIGVIYIGKALRLERDIYVGHSPINYSRDRVSVNGVSENGQYLGAIDVRQTNSTSVSLQNLTPNWYRTELDPFFALSPRPPCFYAWRPEGYPMEVGYCWVEGKPNMSNQRSNGMVECSFNFRGIV